MKFHFLQITRVLIAWLLIFFLLNCFDLGTKFTPFYLGALLGILVAGALKKKSFLKIFLINLVAYFATKISLSIANEIYLRSASTQDFLVYSLIDAFNLFFLVYFAAFFTTWFYWRYEETLSFEAFGFSIFFLWILSSHRNFQLDAPKKLNEIAWAYAIDPINALLGLGVVYIIIVCFYLFLSNNRPLVKEINLKLEKNKFKAISLLTPVVLISLLVFYSNVVKRFLAPSGAGSAMTSEGVGMKNEEGSSPLRFNSGVNKVKQPMAVVRFESDYEGNPTAPMLYFREQALSQYNGKEMVLSTLHLDVDVPQNKQPYFNRKVKEAPGRAQVKHSSYLITDHPVPFAIDYPTSIKAIKNPDPTRFKTAYLADSLALRIPLAALDGEEVGNPDWDEKTWEHYLRAPGSKTKKDIDAKFDNLRKPLLDRYGEDLRYRVFAKQLTAGKITPVQKAQAIMDYLSEKTLYTLSPGHKVGERDDPVAPYLFSDDMRGYCVHFAHAITYLLRSLDIPARIGTGYLTDLTYAKDGHILLSSSDRHAWPEMYIRGIGWVVVDITPQNVEGEQDLIPDAKLLEDLMSKLGPLEEIIDEDFESTFKDSSSDDREFDLRIGLATIYKLLASLFVLFIGLKSWLRYSHILPASLNKKLIRKTKSFSSLMCDLGIPREEAETRLEYAKRLKRERNVEFFALAKLYEVYAYAEDKNFSEAELRKSFRTAVGSYRTKYWWVKRGLAFFNPSSIVRWREC